MKIDRVFDGIDYVYFNEDGDELSEGEVLSLDCVEYIDEVALTCSGCDEYFTVDPEDQRAEPDLDPELIYCDTCNEEARQWCAKMEHLC